MVIIRVKPEKNSLNELETVTNRQEPWSVLKLRDEQICNK